VTKQQKEIDALNMLAIGVLQQEKAVHEGNAVTVTLLNEHLQRGWEQLCFLCFGAGQTPPLTLPELVRWLHMPVAEWAVMGEMLAQQGYSLPLLENGQASELCIQLAEPFVNTYNPRLELEDTFFRALHETCGRIGDPEQYTNARTFINRNSMLRDPYESIAAHLAWHDDVRQPLMACFEPIPRECLRTRGGKSYILLCPHCGWTLRWRGDEAICHTDGICAALYGDLSQSERWVPYVRDMARTKEGVQRFVVAPEVTLFQLYDTLTKEWGLHCTLFPQFDAYDLLIAFPSGLRWAVDVKDHRRAAALAINLTPFRPYPEWERAFYVFPDYRADANYLQEFRNHWRQEKDIEFVGLHAFVATVRKEVNR
jgi:hypothetical protein